MYKINIVLQDPENTFLDKVVLCNDLMISKLPEIGNEIYFEAAIAEWNTRACSPFYEPSSFIVTRIVLDISSNRFDLCVMVGGKILLS